MQPLSIVSLSVNVQSCLNEASRNSSVKVTCLNDKKASLQRIDDASNIMYYMSEKGSICRGVAGCCREKGDGQALQNI